MSQVGQRRLACPAPWPRSLLMTISSSEYRPMNLRHTLIGLSILALSSVTGLKPATAAPLFSQAEVNPNRLIAVAAPYRDGDAHQLLIIEQIANSRACWREEQGYPTTVYPLLREFDFTGICGRSTDSNGYSIRMGGQDLGWRYSLRIVRRNGDMLLVGMPSAMNRDLPELEIGRVGGLTRGFAKIHLNPGWRMTRRMYQGQPIGHIYLTTDQPLSDVAARPQPQPQPAMRRQPLPQPQIFRRPAPQPQNVPIPVPQPDRSSRPPYPVEPQPGPVMGEPIATPPPVVQAPGPMTTIGPDDYVVPTIIIVYE